MLRNMIDSGMPLIWWLGWLLVVIPLIMIARAIDMDAEVFLLFFDEISPQLYWIAWVAGLGAVFAVADVFLLLLHVAGVL